MDQASGALGPQVCQAHGAPGRRCARLWVHPTSMWEETLRLQSSSSEGEIATSIAQGWKGGAESKRGKKKKKECLIASISLKPEVKCLQWPVRPYKICPSILLTLWHLLLLPPPHLLSILLTLNSLLCPRQTMYTFTSK